MMLSTSAQPGQRRFDFAGRSAATPAAGCWVRRDEVVMGTTVSVELWTASRRHGDAAAAAVIDEMHRIDRSMSPHKPASELSRINREAGRRAVVLTAEMYALIERSLVFSRLSDGAFDISYAAVGRLYDYRRRVRPDAEALARARALVGWQGLQLDAQERTLRFARDGMRIDLGGFAKGHAVDRAAALLRQRGVNHAYISAGGDSRVIGCRVDADGGGQRPWSLGVRDPRSEDGRGLVAVLPLHDVSVSTSGDYERFFIADDGVERVHHLIDPATGSSPQQLHSVTVLAGDGLTSEALSKAVFVMGVERGLALVESVPGADAVVVAAGGALHVSAGLSNTTPAVAQ